MIVTVTISRTKQYPVPGRLAVVAWKWYYTWTADDGSHMKPATFPDGTSRIVNIGSYGNGLTDLRAMLKARYAKMGKRVKIVQSWSASQAQFLRATPPPWGWLFGMSPLPSRARVRSYVRLIEPYSAPSYRPFSAGPYRPSQPPHTCTSVQAYSQGGRSLCAPVPRPSPVLRPP